jgi:hypothetical protein
MSRRLPAARLLAVLAGAALVAAVCTPVRAAFAFEVVPRAEVPHRPHRLAYVCAATGAGLIAASFPLARTADRRYDAYLRESDLSRIESRWDATLRADHLASGSLLAGEALLATAAWLRFIRTSHPPRVAVLLAPARCAVSCRF